MYIVEIFSTNSGRKPVLDFILDQRIEAREKIRETIDFLTEFGFHLETKYLRRISGSKNLWELRTSYGGMQYRIFLAKLTDKRIILLHAFIKKTNKTPRKEIETAEKRLIDL